MTDTLNDSRIIFTGSASIIVTCFIICIARDAYITGADVINRLNILNSNASLNNEQLPVYIRVVVVVIE